MAEWGRSGGSGACAGEAIEVVVGVGGGRLGVRAGVVHNVCDVADGIVGVVEVLEGGGGDGVSTSSPATACGDARNSGRKSGTIGGGEGVAIDIFIPVIVEAPDVEEVATARDGFRGVVGGKFGARAGGSPESCFTEESGEGGAGDVVALGHMQTGVACHGAVASSHGALGSWAGAFVTLIDSEGAGAVIIGEGDEETVVRHIANVNFSLCHHLQSPLNDFW